MEREIIEQKALNRNECIYPEKLKESRNLKKGDRKDSEHQNTKATL